MPLTLTLAEGAIPPDKVRETVVRPSDAMLEAHELTGNSVITRETGHFPARSMPEELAALFSRSAHF